MASSLPRITARVDEKTQNLLNQATALSGMSSLNAFVLNAAIEKAQQIIEKDQILKLNQQEAMQLIEALDAPPQANSRLQLAAKRYETKTQ